MSLAEFLAELRKLGFTERTPITNHQDRWENHSLGIVRYLTRTDHLSDEKRRVYLETIRKGLGLVTTSP